MQRQSTQKDFLDEINNLSEVVDDLKSIIERESSPLRNG